MPIPYLLAHAPAATARAYATSTCRQSTRTEQLCLRPCKRPAERPTPALQSKSLANQLCYTTLWSQATMRRSEPPRGMQPTRKLWPRHAACAVSICALPRLPTFRTYRASRHASAVVAAGRTRIGRSLAAVPAHAPNRPRGCTNHRWPQRQLDVGDSIESLYHRAPRDPRPMGRAVNIPPAGSDELLVWGVDVRYHLSPQEPKVESRMDVPQHPDHGACPHQRDSHRHQNSHSHSENDLARVSMIRRVHCLTPSPHHPLTPSRPPTLIITTASI